MWRIVIPREIGFLSLNVFFLISIPAKFSVKIDLFLKCGCYVSFVLFFLSFHFIIDKFHIYSLPGTLDCLSEDPSFVNLKTTFSKVFRASLLLAVLWQKCSYLRWAWREHFSPCESLDKHVLHEMGLSNIFLWSLSRRIVLFEFQFLSLDLVEFCQGFWCFSGFDR